MFIASNISTASCTKHINIRYKYVNEYVKNGVVKFVFVKFAENDSDILTKNQNAELYEKESNKMMNEKLEDVSISENIWS